MLEMEAAASVKVPNGKCHFPGQALEAQKQDLVITNMCLSSLILEWLTAPVLHLKV